MPVELFEYGFAISIWIMGVLFVIGIIASYFLRSVNNIYRVFIFLIPFLIIIFPAIYFIINYIYIVFIDIRNIEIDFNQGVTPIRILSIYLVYKVFRIVDNIYNLLGVQEGSKEHQNMGVSNERKNHIKVKVFNISAFQFFIYSISLLSIVFSLLFYGKIYFSVAMIWLLVFIFDDWNIIVDNLLLNEGSALKEHINKIKYVNYALLLLIELSIFYISNSIMFSNILLQVVFISTLSLFIIIVFWLCHDEMKALIYKPLYLDNPIETHYIKDRESVKFNKILDYSPTKRSENCSFCNKNKHEVKKLIDGSNVYICNECVDLCNDIIKEEVNINESDNFENFICSFCEKEKEDVEKLIKGSIGCICNECIEESVNILKKEGIKFSFD